MKRFEFCLVLIGTAMALSFLIAYAYAESKKTEFHILEAEVTTLGEKVESSLANDVSGNGVVALREELQQISQGLNTLQYRNNLMDIGIFLGLILVAVGNGCFLWRWNLAVEISASKLITPPLAQQSQPDAG